MQETLILLNPNASGGRAARLEAPMRAWLAEHGGGAHLEVTRTIGDIATLVDALPLRSRVIIVGGDGSINQALPAVLRGNHTLAIVPWGSGNDAARALGLYKMRWQDALRHALVATSKAVDVGEARFDDRAVPFMVCLTAGLDSAVALRAITGPKWLSGLPRYLLATLREVAVLRLWDMVVKLDGTDVHSGPALFASTLNTPTFGSGMPAIPHASIADGALDMLLAGPCSRLRTLMLLPRLLIGRHLTDSRVRCQPFETMEISGATPIPLAADGEYLGESAQVKIRVHAAALHVVARSAL